MQAPGGSKGSGADGVSSGKQQQQQPVGAQKEVLLYFGIVDFLQVGVLACTVSTCISHALRQLQTSGASGSSLFILWYTHQCA